MKVRNQGHVPAIKSKMDEHRPAIQAFIAAQSGELIDFAAIRASFPAAKRAELTDGLIHQICLDLGLKVEH